jgi:lipopolysaccharide/colanic/teichoic acid biosynthesis glycosyltransferase
MADGMAYALPRPDQKGSTRRRASLAQRAAKRGLDVIGALTAIVLLAPLMVVIAVAIRRESEGPALFRQTREGYRLSSFTILKFRTMLNRGESRFVQARRDDPRVTRLGAHLRAASLDELPQLFNVLSGSMSLVGPRPHVPELSAQYAGMIEGYYERLEVRPGITGLAQISGLRGTTTPAQMAARIRLDSDYVRTWTFAGDIAICVHTLLIPLGQERSN